MIFSGLTDEEKLELMKVFANGLKRNQALRNPSNLDSCWNCKYKSKLHLNLMGFPACWGFHPDNYENGKMKCCKKPRGEG